VNKYNVGLLGCGDICDIYFKNGLRSEILTMAACASLHEEKAHRKAQEYNIPKACSIDDLINDPQIDIILNLTVPEVHAKFNLAALEAGKHVYSEKPLAAVPEDGQTIIALAKSKGLIVGCAPDTFLGGRLQTCRKAIDEGLIGEPTAAAAFVVSPGHEWHHPNPEFFYKPGGGPLLDIGPYYLTALVSLLGPVTSCCAFSKTTFPERTVLCGPKSGESIKVEVPTYISGTMEFSTGVIGTITASFDIWDSQLPRIEIYGTAGTLCVPDVDPLEGPNLFGGPVLIKTKETSRWRGVPRKPELQDWDDLSVSHKYNENSRGLGLSDMAYAIRDGRPHKASGEMAYHVLEIGYALLESAKNRQYYHLSSTCNRPDPLPVDFSL
jgi:predicted dehydrogenase